LKHLETGFINTLLETNSSAGIHMVLRMNEWMNEWSLRAVVGGGESTLFGKHVALGRLGIWTAGVKERIDISTFPLLKLYNRTR
jgi:hypothetical protein